MAKVSAQEIRNHESAQRAREGTEGMEQCPGCAPGGLFRRDPRNDLVDGCPSHSTEAYNATCRDSGHAGGQL